MTSNIKNVLKDLRQGRPIILTDHPDRENEGDLVFPAEMITAEIVNLMIRHGSGIVCLSLQEDKITDLGLRPMVPAYENKSQRQTPFTISIEAKHGITTGVSAKDRVTTILAAVKGSAADIISPGHIFPLQAKNGGVLERDGHTEGSIDLMKLAGLMPAAVICELMNADGTMMHGDQIIQFANDNKINIISIDEIKRYRILHENLISEEVSAVIPTEKYSNLTITTAKEKYTECEHILLSNNFVSQSMKPLVRIHSSCKTGDLFGSMRCDCQEQLHYSLQRISEEGGILFYLSQEGRGIGLFNKIKAYHLQEQGLDTIEANLALNLPIDARQYYIVANILRNKGINEIRLLTNNPHKVEDLTKYDINVYREPIPIFNNEFNKKYLLAKKIKLDHIIQ